MSSRTLVRVRSTVAVALLAALAAPPAHAAPRIVSKFYPAGVKAGDRFGAPIALVGSQVLVGATLDATRGARAGAFYVFDVSSGLPVEKQKIFASDARPRHQFGYRVVGGSGFIAAAGIRSGTPLRPTATYVFEPGPVGWVEVARLPAPGFRGLVAKGGAEVVATGIDLIAVAMTYPSPDGQIAVYRRVAGRWTADGLIVWKGRVPSLAIDRGRVFVGQSMVGTATRPRGAVLVYSKVGGTWRLDSSASPAPVGVAPRERFGAGIAISGDLLVVSSFGVTRPGPDLPALYFFRRRGAGWVQEARILLSEPVYAHVLAVGGETVVFAGRVYRKLKGRWVQTVMLERPEDGRNLVGRIAMVPGGRIGFVGYTPDSDKGTNAGAVYVVEGLDEPANDVRVEGLRAAVTGDAVTLSGKICSGGAVPAFEARLYFDQPKALAGCHRRNDAPWPAADAEGTLRWDRASCLSFSERVGGLPNGVYVTRVYADARCDLGELDETNNAGSVRFTINSGPSDLSVKGFRARVFVDGTVTLEGELCHTGKAARDVAVRLWEHLASPPSACGPHSGGVEERLAIPAGTCLAFSLPGLRYPAGGRYTARIVVDAGCEVPESDETNNAAAATFTVP